MERRREQEWIELDKQRERAEKKRANTQERARKLGFTYIEENKFLFREHREMEYDQRPECDCKKKKRNCEDSSCNNRAAMTECFPDCKTKCQNQRFQKKQWKDLMLVKRGKMGYGILTAENIRKGEFILEYVGEIIDDDIRSERLMQKGVRHHYQMKLEQGFCGYVIFPFFLMFFFLKRGIY